MADLKRVSGKTNLLFQLAEAAVEHPDGVVKEVLYPVVSERVLRDLVKEYQSGGPIYRQHVHTVMRASYRSHYRRMVPAVLRALTFRSNNDEHRPLIRALTLLKQYADSDRAPIYYASTDDVPIEGVVRAVGRDVVIKTDDEGNERINRINYEIAVLQVLRERLRCKEIWVEGAKKFGNYVEYQVLSSLRWWHIYTSVGALFFRERKLPPNPHKRKAGCGGRMPEPPPS